MCVTVTWLLTPSLDCRVFTFYDFFKNKLIVYIVLDYDYCILYFATRLGPLLPNK